MPSCSRTPSYRKADITFDKDYDLDLGGLHARLFAMGANHTRGDIAIWIEADRVLFTGDIAMKAQPAFASPYSTIRQWLASLDRLEALKPAVIVPSARPGRRCRLHRRLSRLSRPRCAIARRPRSTPGTASTQAVETVTAAMTDSLSGQRAAVGAIKAASAEAP